MSDHPHWQDDFALDSTPDEVAGREVAVFGATQAVLPELQDFVARQATRAELDISDTARASARPWSS